MGAKEQWIDNLVFSHMLKYSSHGNYKSKAPQFPSFFIVERWPWASRLRDSAEVFVSSGFLISNLLRTFVLSQKRSRL